MSLTRYWANKYQLGEGRDPDFGYPTSDYTEIYKAEDVGAVVVEARKAIEHTKVCDFAGSEIEFRCHKCNAITEFLTRLQEIAP